MRLPHTLACLLLLAVGSNASASGLYSEVNRLRTGVAKCAVQKRLPPLKPNAALERVAASLAQGGRLQTGLNAAGYRATRSIALSLKGRGAGAKAAQMLAKQSYCAQLQNAAMTEIGIYLDADLVWIVIAAPFTPSVPVSEQEAGQRVLDLINQARATPRYCGDQALGAAGPVRWNALLAESSRLHAEDMAHHNYFSHSGRDGSNSAQRADRAGYRYRAIGENIAAGPMKPEQVVAGWIKSPAHCANLMNPVFVDMGVAFAVDPASDRGAYWTQTFGALR